MVLSPTRLAASCLPKFSTRFDSQTTYDEFFCPALRNSVPKTRAWNRTTYVQQPHQYSKAEFSEPSNQIVKDLFAASAPCGVTCERCMVASADRMSTGRARIGFGFWNLSRRCCRLSPFDCLDHGWSTTVYDQFRCPEAVRSAAVEGTFFGMFLGRTGDFPL